MKPEMKLYLESKTEKNSRGDDDQSKNKQK